MSIRLTELTESEIKDFMHFLNITPNHNFLYGKKKNSSTKKLLWFITSNPIWTVLTEVSYVVVFDNNSLYLKKAFTSLFFGKFEISTDIDTLPLSDLGTFSLSSNDKQIFLDFETIDKTYSFYFDNHCFNQTNYNILKNVYS